MPPQRTIVRPQRRLGIYIGFNSPSIIKCLDPLTGDIFIARYVDCHFNETMFLGLEGDKNKERLVTKEVLWGDKNKER